MEAFTPKKRWRPRLRFSLRALMIAMTVVCVFLGYRVHRARVQRDAVAALRSAGAEVMYDWDVSNSDARLDEAIDTPVHLRKALSPPPGPEWLRKAIGDEYFQEVFEVYWHFESVPKSGALENLLHFPHLRHVSLRSDFDGQQPDSIPELKHLKELSLTGWRGTDKHMEQIGRLSSLKSLELQLDYDSITIAGFEHLARLQNLEHLDLSVSELTDDYLPTIGRLHALRSLHLDGTDITDAGLVHLNELHELREFSAFGSCGRYGPDSDPKVSLGDQALKLLATHKKLEIIAIGISVQRPPPPPRISREGLAAIANLPLTELKLYHTTLTDDDLETLRRRQIFLDVR